MFRHAAGILVAAFGSPGCHYCRTWNGVSALDDTTTGTPPQPVEPTASTDQPGSPAKVCRFLGYYSDQARHAGRADGDNYCHVADLPFAVPLDYQASACLGGGWPDCVAYRSAIARESSAAQQRPRLVLAPQRVAILVAAIICLAVAAYFAIRPGGWDRELVAMSGPAGVDSTPQTLPAGLAATATIDDATATGATPASTVTGGDKTPVVAAMGALTATPDGTSAAPIAVTRTTVTETLAATATEASTVAATDTPAPTTPPYRHTGPNDSAHPLRRSLPRPHRRRWLCRRRTHRR